MYALKVVDKHLVLRHRLVGQLRQERNILDRCYHPGIARLHFTFQDDAAVYLGLELCPNGPPLENLSVAAHSCRGLFAMSVASRAALLSCLFGHIYDPASQHGLQLHLPQIFLLAAVSSQKLEPVSGFLQASCTIKYRQGRGCQRMWRVSMLRRSC